METTSFFSSVVLRMGTKVPWKENANRVNRIISILFQVLGSCPTGWEKFDKHCYLFRDSDLQPWAAARFKCLNQGGNLVSITSEQEQDFITFHYRRISAGKIWIGKYSSIDTTPKKKV